MVIHKINRLEFVVVLVCFFVIGSVFGYVSVMNAPKETVYIPFSPFSEEKQLELEESRAVRMKLPAVSVTNNTGVSAFLDVTIIPGTGKIFANLNNVLVSPETQHSARLAARIASNLTKTSINKVDIIYDLYADATILEGPSAGAAFTIATMAALQNRSLRQDIMVTGTVNHDGTIGPAGKIYEKSLAAKNAGAILFLVPVGTSIDINYTENEYCSFWGEKEFCTPEFTPNTRNIGKETGIEIVEIRTVQTAAKYFII